MANRIRSFWDHLEGWFPGEEEHVDEVTRRFGELAGRILEYREGLIEEAPEYDMLDLRAQVCLAALQLAVATGLHDSDDDWA